MQKRHLTKWEEHAVKYSRAINASACDCSSGACDKCNPSHIPNKYQSNFIPTDENPVDTSKQIVDALVPKGFIEYGQPCRRWIDEGFLAQCGYFDAPPAAIQIGIDYASEILYRLSGRIYQGVCSRTVYPACRDGASCTDSCHYDTLPLPAPINTVESIVVNGKVLDPALYRISSSRELIRVDGQPWWRFNRLDRDPFQPHPNGAIIPPPESYSVAHDWVESALGSFGIEHHIAPMPTEYEEADSWVAEFLAHHPAPQQKPVWWKKALDEGRIKTHKGTNWTGIDNRLYPEKAITPCSCEGSCNCQEYYVYVPKGESWAGAWNNLDSSCCSGGKPTPWWVERIFDPGAKASVSAMPVPSVHFSGWINQTIQELGSREVSEWVANYADSHQVKIKQNLPFQTPTYARVNNTMGRKIEPYENATDGTLELPDWCDCDVSWCINYWQGFCPPISAQTACAELARAIAVGICNECHIQGGWGNISEINRDGLKLEFRDKKSLINEGMTGIPLVDLWLRSVNPDRLSRRPTAYSADLEFDASGARKRRVWTLR